MRVCSECKEPKDDKEFSKNKNKKDGFRSSCKKCDSAQNKKHRQYRIRNGLCVRCGRKNDTNRRNCSKCLEIARKRSEGKYSERISSGLCGYCGKRPIVRSGKCSVCLKTYIKNYNNSQEQRILSSAKSRAKKKGLEFNIDISDIYIPNTCPLLDIPIVAGNGVKHDNSPSLDRKNPKKGYIKGNVWVVSEKANRMKTDSTIGEILTLAKNIHKILTLD